MADRDVRDGQSGWMAFCGHDLGRILAGITPDGAVALSEGRLINLRD